MKTYHRIRVTQLKLGSFKLTGIYMRATLARNGLIMMKKNMFLILVSHE